MEGGGGALTRDFTVHLTVWFQEELIRAVEEYIEKVRAAFPRLFFLSDNDLLSLLAWSRNPKDLLPFVRKCFPGIKNLQFALPRDGNLKLASSLDTALNGKHVYIVLDVKLCYQYCKERFKYQGYQLIPLVQIKVAILNYLV